MRFWRKSLRARLTTFFILFMLISGVLVGTLAYWQSRVALQEDVLRRLETAASLKENEINRWLVEKKQEVSRLTQPPVVKASVKNLLTSDKSDPAVQLDYENLSGYLNDVLAESPDLLQVTILDQDGQIILSTDQAQEGQFHVTDTFFIEGLKDTFIQNVYFLPAIDRTTITIATPLGDETGPVGGVMVAHLNLDRLDEIILERAGLGETGETYLVDSLNGFVSQPGIDPAAFPRGVHTEGIERALAGENGSGLYLNYNGVPVIGVYRWLTDQEMVLLAEIEQSEALAPANQLGLTIALITALVISLGSAAGYFTARQISRPVVAIAETAEQVSAGDLEQQAPVMTEDEIGELAEAFNSMTAQLRQSFSTLEEQAQERTAELALSVEVGQRVTTIRDMEVLLSTVAEFIWDQFKLHYVQVFLVDDINQNLVLRAGTGQAGQELLTRNFSLPINVDTAVGRSAVEHQSIVVGDTTVGSIDTSKSIPAAWYSVLIKQEQEKRPASVLPESQSELAIPLIVEGRVLGVLDLQDDKLKSFAEKDLSVFESIAVQLSISIDSARQWELAQQAQKRAEQALQQLTHEVWADKLVYSRGEEGFVYDLSNVMPLSDASLVSDNNVSVPLVVQDQTIGQLNVNASEQDLSEDEQVLLQAVAQQLAQKAENLRLFEATQQRASREQIARQIIDKVRGSRNIEAALRTATEELNKALGTARAAVDLQVPQSDLAKSSSQNEAAADTGQPAGGTNGKTIIDFTSTETPPEPTDHDISDNGEDDAPLE